MFTQTGSGAALPTFKARPRKHKGNEIMTIEFMDVIPVDLEIEIDGNEALIIEATVFGQPFEYEALQIRDINGRFHSFQSYYDEEISAFVRGCNQVNGG